MQCIGAAKSGVFKWAITRRDTVIADVRRLNGTDVGYLQAFDPTEKYLKMSQAGIERRVSGPGPGPPTRRPPGGRRRCGVR